MKSAVFIRNILAAGIGLLCFLLLVVSLASASTSFGEGPPCTVSTVMIAIPGFDPFPQQFPVYCEDGEECCALADGKKACAPVENTKDGQCVDPCGADNFGQPVFCGSGKCCYDGYTGSPTCIEQDDLAEGGGCPNGLYCDSEVMKDDEQCCALPYPVSKEWVCKKTENCGEEVGDCDAGNICGGTSKECPTGQVCCPELPDPCIEPPSLVQLLPYMDEVPMVPCCDSTRGSKACLPGSTCCAYAPAGGDFVIECLPSGVQCCSEVTCPADKKCCLDKCCASNQECKVAEDTWTSSCVNMPTPTPPPTASPSSSPSPTSLPTSAPSSSPSASASPRPSWSPSPAPSAPSTPAPTVSATASSTLLPTSTPSPSPSPS